MSQYRHSRERARLVELFPKESIGAEIGVWKGDFAAQLLARVRPRRLHLIDPWTFAAESGYEQAWYGGAQARSQADMDRIYEGVLVRFAREIAAGTVVVHRRASADAAAEFEDESLDWVYVDGNHLFEFVRQDLERFAPKIRPGGLIAGDDYGTAGWWDDGVRRAVDAFVAESGYRPLMLRDQFVLEKTGAPQSSAST